MFLSTEQTRAAMHGINDRFSWRLLDRPVGPQPIPSWCKDVSVYWADGYTNSPSVTLKVTENVRRWPDKRFRVEDGSYYRAYHEDGRLEQYAHGGPISDVELQMFQSIDGTLRQYRRCGTEWGNEPGIQFVEPWGDRLGYEPGEYVKVMRWATTAQGGFGGSHVHLVMEDGSDLVLRGPWHVGSPAGYAEVAYVDVSERDRYGQRKWSNRTATGGLYLTLNLFVRIMSRFAPHLPLAEVTYSGCTTIEPMKPEWDVPKRLVYEREWQKRQAARKAVA